jgi:hypothetical protein
LIPSIINKFFKKEKVELWFSEETSRQYISPVEIVGYILENILLCNSNKMNALNIVGESTKIIDVVQTCHKLIGKGDFVMVQEKDSHLYSSFIKPARKFILMEINSQSKTKIMKENLEKQINIQTKRYSSL